MRTYALNMTQKTLEICISESWKIRNPTETMKTVETTYTIINLDSWTLKAAVFPGFLVSKYPNKNQTKTEENQDFILCFADALW